MKINPPIEARSTAELLEIVEAPGQWQPDVFTLARKELRQRGVTDQTQELRRKSQSSFQRKIATIKARASYTTSEKLLIVLFGPILVFVATNWFLFDPDDEGYKKKNRQRLLFLLLGFLVWIITLAIIFN